jgi:hypothetical protein
LIPMPKRSTRHPPEWITVVATLTALAGGHAGARRRAIVGKGPRIHPHDRFHSTSLMRMAQRAAMLRATTARTEGPRTTVSMPATARDRRKTADVAFHRHVWDAISGRGRIVDRLTKYKPAATTTARMVHATTTRVTLLVIHLPSVREVLIPQVSYRVGRLRSWIPQQRELQSSIPAQTPVQSGAQ